MAIDIVLSGLAVAVLCGQYWILFKVIRFYVKRELWRRDIIRNADDDWCMCGDRVDSHNFGSGHSPVGMRSYHMNNLLEMRIE